MAHQQILTDVNGNPIPQIWNSSENKWEPDEGSRPAVETAITNLQTKVQEILDDGVKQSGSIDAEQIIDEDDSWDGSRKHVNLDLTILQRANDFDFYIDCNYEPLHDEKIVDVEGCLTLTGRYFKVERYKTILFAGTMFWKPHKQLVKFQRTVTGVESVILQHETDHAKGTLISDIGVELYLYR